MIQIALQRLLLDSLLALSLLTLGSILSIYACQSVNLMHEFAAIVPAVRFGDILALQFYRLYGVILIGFASYAMFRVYGAEL
jgi:hypothetical protein